MIEDESEIENNDELKQRVFEKKQAEEQKDKEIAKKETEKIIKDIKKRFRISFVRFGIILLALVIIVVSVMVWGIPQWQKSRYYNPLPHEYENDVHIHMGLYDDMKRYTSLFAPDKVWRDIHVNDLGGGDYSLSFTYLYPNISTMLRTGSDYSDYYGYYKEIKMNGKISKGQLEIYGENIFTPRPSYPFYPYYANVSNKSYAVEYNYDTKTMEEMKKEMASTVAGVNDVGIYNVYVTFDQVYQWHEAANFLNDATKKNDKSNYDMMSLWMAVCQKTSDDLWPYEASATLGFNLYSAFHDYGDHYYNYNPSYDFGLPNRIRHLVKSEDFMKMMGCNEICPKYNPEITNNIDSRYGYEAEYLNNFADNIEKNGIFTYGCYYEGVHGDLVKALAKDSHVSYLYVEKIG